MQLYHMTTVDLEEEEVVEAEGELVQRNWQSGRKERRVTWVAAAVDADRPILSSEGLAIEAAVDQAYAVNSCSQGCCWCCMDSWC